MCGIVGVASRAPLADGSWVERGCDAIRHRGPDDSGIYRSPDGRVALGHRRLAILELSQLGHQPMQGHDGSWVVYNGEIYNFKAVRTELESKGHAFRSNSDTEVVLAAYAQWGQRFVEHLDGMFALALYDPRENRLVLARDRAGEKPLFYRLQGGELRFASELKALFADPAFDRVVDPVALDCYLAMGYVPGDLCMIAGVAKLPPAHVLSFDLATGKAAISRYWDLPAPPAPGRLIDAEALVDELNPLLEAAVRRMLVADVPVGLLLSGGVDSSLVTAMAARTGGTVKTYTVGFPDHADYDETAHAALISAHFGTDHTVLEADAIGPDLLGDLAYQYDEPIIDSSMIPTFLVTQQIRKHCKVALGGDGGDELFGGYHSASRVAALEGGFANKIPLFARRAIGALSARAMPIGMKRRAGLRMYAADMAGELPSIANFFDPHSRARLTASIPRTDAAEAIRSSRTPAEADAVQRMTRFDFANYMVEDILVKVDRASMLNSLEVRTPFLDRALIEFAFGKVPSSLKATPFARKILLRKLAARVLPPAFDSVRKQGFGIPLDHWLAGGGWRDRFEAVLFDRGSSFAPATVSGLFAGLARGRPVKEHLFGLALFEEWRKAHRVSLPDTNHHRETALDVRRETA